MDRGLLLLKKVIQVANSSIGYEDRLQGILDLLVRKERAERAVLFSLTPDKETLELQKISPREFSWDGCSFHPAKTPVAETLVSRQALFIPRLNRKEHKVLLRTPLFKGFSSLIIQPVEDDNLLYGVLCLLSQKTTESDPEQWEVLDLVARELAGVIRNSWVYTESRKRIAELSVLYQVGKVIGSTLELDDLIKRTVAITAQVINAQGSALVILEKEGDEIIVESEFGPVPPQVKRRIIQDILNQKGNQIYHQRSASSDEPLAFSPEGNNRPLPGKSGPLSSFMCIPLLFKGPYRGRLCVYEKIPMGSDRIPHFSEEELSILSTIGNIIASSLENALTFQKIETLARKNEWMVRNLSTLYQIDSAMMTSASLKDLPQIILEAITLKQGLGFNRAILFLADEGKKILTPMAWSIQRESSQEVRPPKEEHLRNDTLSGYFVRQAAQIRNARQEADQAINTIKVPLEKEAGILARTFLEGRTFLVKRATDDPLTNKDLAKRLNLDSFASLPILVKDKPIGVIEVDNFLDKRPITQEDLNLLSMLAHQAGLALENARLYSYIEKTNEELKAARERLIESEKMMAIGEMASGLAHEIRNPLVSIGGFVRRLHRKFPNDDQVQSYFQVIINEVERLEKILNEIMDFSQDPRGNYKEWPVNRIVEEALGLIQRDLDEAHIRVRKELGNIPKLFGDSRQLVHVFYNLFLNAWQAMPQGGELTIRTCVKKEPERSWITCEITDTGGGIPPELLHNIFNPFFTTKVHGSGLGLPIVHKIITRHNGEVDIDNRPGEGVSFLVKLPTAKEIQQFFPKTKLNGEKKNETDINRR
jgi:signal transduction histidine kinase